MSEKKQLIVKWSVTVVAGFLCFILWSFIYFRVFGFMSPKTAIMKWNNRELRSGMQMLSSRMDRAGDQLDILEMRDNDVYRQVLGMKAIPADLRRLTFPDPDLRYAYLDSLPHSAMMRRTALRMDELTRRASVLSQSLDAVTDMSRRAGEMASCVPCFNPVDMFGDRISISSRFGYRIDPLTHDATFHSGIDISGPVGEPVYVTGDGIVESAEVDFSGYGNCIVVDHGFGYKTRYAHLRLMHVFAGMKVHRGDQIATMGNSGRSTGSHLHYEVSYMDNKVNPMNYLNEDMTREEYLSMVHPDGGGF